MYDFTLQPRRRDPDRHNDQLRATDLQLQVGLASPSYLGHQLAPPCQPHLRQQRRCQGRRRQLDLRHAQERLEILHRQRRPAYPGGRLPVWIFAGRQQAGQGDQGCRLGSSEGEQQHRRVAY